METPTEESTFRSATEYYDTPYQIASGEQSGSMESSQPGSAGPRKSKKTVGFTGPGEPVDTQNRPRSFLGVGQENNLLQISPANSGSVTPSHSRNGSVDDRFLSDRSHLPNIPQDVTDELRAALQIRVPPPRPRPALRRGDSAQSVVDEEEDWSGAHTPQAVKARQAYERGKKWERDERVRSAPSSRRSSPNRIGSTSFRTKKDVLDDIPLEDLGTAGDDSAYTSDNDEIELIKRRAADYHGEAHRLVRSHTRRDPHLNRTPPSRSGAATPVEDLEPFEYHVPRPSQYRGGILGSILKLYNNTDGSRRSPLHSRGSSMSKKRSGNSNHGMLIDSANSTPGPSPPRSGTTTPLGKSGRLWQSSKRTYSPGSGSLAHLVGSASIGASPAVTGLGAQVAERLRQQEAERKRPGLGKRTGSSSAIAALNRLSQPRLEEQIHITVHIAETIQRQKYLLKLCRALMEYGAPTHRLEEYMKMSARVLEIEAQFLYIPGSMIISFDDPTTHTTEVKLVRVTQGLDLGKLRDVHELYKEVVHDRIGVEEATQRLNEVTKRAQKHSKWVLIPVYGLASASVGPFAFGARPIDLPIAFFLGCLLCFLQHFVAPRSDLYANVFEIAAAVITSFLARAFGSIRGGDLFCFSALAQSSIALILPGYAVLCASLELQSRSIVAGSVRMVYAIIYSLFLGYGITIGTAIYGIMDKNATSATSCSNSLSWHWYLVAVPIFTFCLIVVNQAKWKQAPVMMIIAFVGYIVNYASSKRFVNNTQVSSTLGALAIGVMANLYSRIGKRCENYFIDLWEDRLRQPVKRLLKRVGVLRSRLQHSPRSAEEGLASSITGHDQAETRHHLKMDSESTHVRRPRTVGYGLAAAAMLPAIFVQVPSGLAVSGSLISGITSANEIVGNTTTVSSTTSSSDNALNSTAFNVSYSVIQVAIGITVGLFLSAIIVYPFGKRRSGLFSF